VQMHMAHGAEPARYTYMGEVFRKQEHRGPRANEYFQVGYELFDGSDRAAADAEVFALFSAVLAPLKLRAVIGDIGVLRAAVSGLEASERRKAALMRHIWRPRRFRALLDRFGGVAGVSEQRQQQLARFANTPAEQVIAAAGPLLGLRSEGEIAARMQVLQEDAREAPVPAAQRALLDDILALRLSAPDALARLRDMVVDMPALGDAVEGVAARLAALESHGIDPQSLEFEASYGRSTMEYYDGFVFGFLAEGQAGLPPVATGGRYDALTRVLGQGQAIPAVGGVIRPGVVAQLKEAGA